MKTVSRNVAVALGIALIVLIASMMQIGTMQIGTMQIGNKDTHTASPNEMFLQLDATVADQNDTWALLNAWIPKLIDEWNQLPAWDGYRLNGPLARLLLQYRPSLVDIATFINQFESPSMVQGNAGGLQLSMTLEKTVYKLGEPISIPLTISNVSNQTITFGMSYWNDYDFHVYNDTNDIYWYSANEIGGAIPNVIALITLNPGDSIAWTLVWQQTDFSSQPVSPGTYYIVGVVGAPFFYGEPPSLETTPLQITILPTLPF